MDPEMEPFGRYLDQLTNDPFQISILATHGLIEEMVEAVSLATGHWPSKTAAVVITQ